MSWASKLIRNINTDDVVDSIVNKVMDELDLEDLVKSLQEKLVSALIERITTELSEALNKGD